MPVNPDIRSEKEKSIRILSCVQLVRGQMEKRKPGNSCGLWGWAVRKNAGPRAGTL